MKLFLQVFIVTFLVLIALVFVGSMFFSKFPFLFALLIIAFISIIITVIIKNDERINNLETRVKTLEEKLSCETNNEQTEIVNKNSDN